jgi:hypothetical protein
MQFHTFSGTRLIGIAAIICTAILLPAAALGPPRPAAPPGSLPARPRPTHPVTVYVVNSGGR